MAVNDGFQQILNFRDVGRSVNSLAKNNSLTEGRLFRSARPDRATKSDQILLKQTFGIKTIVDLRTDTEREPQSGRKGRHAAVAGIEGINYSLVNFNGRSYSSALMKQLTYWQTTQLVTLYALGFRKSAISVLGGNVLSQRGLSGLAQDSLSHSTSEVKAVFDLLADPKQYPVLVHCTQGKDRTGLVVLLVLLLLEVDVKVISEDYLLSQRELEPERKERLEEIRSIGLSDDFAECDPHWADHMSRWIDETYGGVEHYLDRCGVSRKQQAAVKSLMRQS